jgi:hypothetical protein
MRRLPPYGRPLVERLRHGNPPFFVAICTGLDAWNRARQWAAADNDIAPLILPAGIQADRLTWPVQGLHCVLDRMVGPSDAFVESAVGALFNCGARAVVSIWADIPKGTIQHWQRNSYRHS